MADDVQWLRFCIRISIPEEFYQLNRNTVFNQSARVFSLDYFLSLKVGLWVIVGDSPGQSEAIIIIIEFF